MKTILVIAMIAAGSPAAAAVTTYSDRTVFLSATGATQATGALPNEPFAHSTLTSNTVTFTAVSGNQSIYSGSYSVRLPGNVLSIDGLEDINAAFAAPVQAFGFDFHEPRFDPNLNAPFVDSTFTVTLLSGLSIVGGFTFNAPDDVAAFVGASSSVAFDHVQIRETTGAAENEFYGLFYTAGPGAVGSVPEPAQWTLMVGGLALAGIAMRRRRGSTQVAA